MSPEKQNKDDEKMAQALVEAYEKLKSQVQQVIVYIFRYIVNGLNSQNK